MNIKRLANMFFMNILTKIIKFKGLIICQKPSKTELYKTCKKSNLLISPPFSVLSKHLETV